MCKKTMDSVVGVSRWGVCPQESTTVLESGHLLMGFTTSGAFVVVNNRVTIFVLSGV
jgi:hypothetical protein